MRANQAPPTTLPIAKSTSSISKHTTEEVLARVLAYLEAHLIESLPLDEVCRDNLIGRSYLQKIFREKYSSGVIEYFSDLKIRSAKELILQRRNNFTEIAHALGFASIHYFSRRFKKRTGMTPSEYASSVKAIAENVNFNR